VCIRLPKLDALVDDHSGLGVVTIERAKVVKKEGAPSRIDCGGVLTQRRIDPVAQHEPAFAPRTAHSRLRDECALRGTVPSEAVVDVERVARPAVERGLRNLASGTPIHDRIVSGTPHRV
jgi:hypothetical protein